MGILRDDTTIGGLSILDLVYPIGSIYETSNSSFNPATHWGGTWERIKGKVLIGVDENDTTFSTSAKTGGSKDMIVPSHTHTFTGTAASHTHTFTGSAATSGNQSASHTHTGTTNSAGGHSHNIRYGSYGTSGGGYIVLRRWLAEDAYTGLNDATSTAGAHTHTMTTGNQSASHTHSVTAKGTNASTSITPAGTISTTGSSATGANLPPYYTIFIWRRTA